MFCFAFLLLIFVPVDFPYWEFAIVIALKWWDRRRFFNELRMARITVPELASLLESGAAPVILDVRSLETPAPPGLAWQDLGSHGLPHPSAKAAIQLARIAPSSRERFALAQPGRE